MSADLEIRSREHLLLGGTPDAPALVTADRTLTYAELAAEVGRVADLLGDVRRLVLLEAASDVATVVTYLATLAGRHPVLLTAPGDVDRHADLVDRYRPDVVQTAATGFPRELRAGTTHALHPELAVLLSTSGSTGSPKLVRLSRDNILANACSIADYLAIRGSDRAPTSLPLHYCYGLSVLNSHLVAGASVVLTDLSVTTECFWDLMTATRATSLAGVPYTFDLLDASGFADRELPSLRYVTQAGGRMAPERVTAYADLGRSRGWDLYVMYGQTEATARMAYLPPDRATTRPNSIGLPVPGGSLRVDPVPGLDDSGVGELVYTGPNVMMGYAEHPEDLTRGPALAELRTGDLGRRASDGLWEVTGRLNRNAKVFGLRLDLDRIEEQLAHEGVTAGIVAHDDRLTVFVDRPRTSSRTAALVASLTSLPPTAVRVSRVEALPTTATGKTDYAALDRQARLVPEQPTAPATTVSADMVRDLYAELLGRPDATTRDSFVDLRGDSLSYVEVSVRLSDLLGHLPTDWPLLDPGRLAASAVRRRRFGVLLDSSVLLRALAITIVVATHADLVQWQGGAHVLLAVAGYSLARFPLRVPGRGARVRAVLRVAAAIAVPACAWITAVEIAEGEYHPSTAVFLNGLLGSNTWTDDWHFWFLETLVWSSVGVAALLACPVADYWQRRHPFGFAMAVLGVTLVIRYAWAGLEAGPTERYTVGVVLWCLALGWAAAEARTITHRLLVAAVAVAATLGFFGDLQRELIVITGVLVLLAQITFPAPRLLALPIRLVAGASLWIYLTQWEVYPGFEDAGHPVLAIVASLAVGVAASLAYDAGRVRLRRLRTCPSRATTPEPVEPSGDRGR